MRLSVCSSGSTLCSLMFKLAKMRFLSIIAAVFLVLYKKSTSKSKKLHQNIDLILADYFHYLYNFNTSEE